MKKKAATSFEGFSDISSGTPSSPKELVLGPSAPPASVSSDVTTKPLSDLWTYYSFSGLIATDALIHCIIIVIIITLQTATFILNQMWCLWAHPFCESDFIASCDPVLSCTAVVTLSEDKHMTDDGARDAPAFGPTCDAFSFARASQEGTFDALECWPSCTMSTLVGHWIWLRPAWDFRNTCYCPLSSSSLKV